MSTISDTQDEAIVNDLKDLKSEIEADPQIDDDLFFFPEYRGLNGFFGTGNVWFVGEKPSTSSFPDPAVNLLYDTLFDNGFENAHLTDITKERGSVPDDGIPHEEMARVRPYFQREVRLLEPDLIIAMSKNVKQALKFMAVTDGIEVGYVHHYSYANRPHVDEDVFIEKVQSYAEDMSNTN